MRKYRATVALVLLAGLLGWVVGYFARPEPEPDPLPAEVNRLFVGNRMSLAEVEALLGPGKMVENHVGDPNSDDTYEWLGTSWRVHIRFWRERDQWSGIDWYPCTPPPPTVWKRMRDRLGL